VADIGHSRRYMTPASDGPEIGPAPVGYWRTGSDMAAEMDIETRRRRLRFRAWHRGIRETDLIMGRFADAHLESFTVEDMADFEGLLDIPDRDILDWVTGAEPIPDGQRTPMLSRILAFHGTR
jgi:antitoxin CptB